MRIAKMTAPCRSVVFVVWLSIASGGIESDAQEAQAVDDEIKAVFRISKKFVADAVDDQISAELPYSANVLGFHCCGTIKAKASLAVNLVEEGRQAIFSIRSSGSGKAGVKGRRGPILAFGSAWGTFTTETLVKFDGRRFVHWMTTPNARVCGQVCRVTGRRDRPIGRIVGCGAMPVANRMLPGAVKEAVPIANGYLKSFVENTAHQIIEKLNQSTPLEETVHRLFPLTSDWRFQVSSTSDYLQSAYGPPNADVPSLMGVDDQWEKINVQIWLHTVNEEAQVLARLSKLPLANELLDQYVQATVPELDRFGKNRTIEAMEDWVIITFGPND